VATISRMLKNIGLFCKRALQKRPIFCKETYIFKHPTNRSHPIFIIICYYSWLFIIIVDDTTHSCDWHDSSICATRLIHTWHDSFICVTWPIYMCDTTYHYEWHDSFLWLTRLITRLCPWHDLFRREFPPTEWVVSHMVRVIDTNDTKMSHIGGSCHILMHWTHSFVWRDSFICDMTHWHEWHDLCVTWLIHMCDMTHSFVWRDSFICDMTHWHEWHDLCVTWLIHLCDVTHSYVTWLIDTNDTTYV